MKTLSCLMLLALTLPAFGQVTVVGEGVVSATPDMATVVVSVVTEHKEAAPSVEKNNKTMARIINAVVTAGITKKELQTNMFNVAPKYRYADQEVFLIGYVTTNSLTITVCKAELLGKILDVVINNGANKIESVSWGFQNPRENLDKARVLAVKDAKRKAEAIAATAGTGLGQLLTISEQTARVSTRVYSDLEASSAKQAPVEAGSQALRITVNATWSLKSQEIPKIPN